MELLVCMYPDFIDAMSLSKAFTQDFVQINAGNIGDVSDSESSDVDSVASKEYITTMTTSSPVDFQESADGDSFCDRISAITSMVSRSHVLCLLICFGMIASGVVCLLTCGGDAE